MGFTPGNQAGSCLSSFELLQHPTWMQSPIFMRTMYVTANGLPWLVADDGGEVVGYAYAGPYRPRLAYRHTVEDSIYIRADRLGAGVGRVLMPALIDATQACGMRQMIAVIGDSSNQASINLHRRFGFKDAGLLKDVGFKFGRWLDTVFMQRSLG
jgi:phosphinothricin acetyltransferase